jgi:hypothetical protein
MATIARQVLPFLPLMDAADEQVTRLAEMHADDTALRSSDPGPLATALVILATPATPATPAAPAAGLAAAATDAVGRIHRLLGPAEPQLGPVRRHLLRAAVAALVLAPALLALAPAAVALVLGRVPGA